MSTRLSGRASRSHLARRTRSAAATVVENLVQRFLLSVVPNPIVPDNGEANLLQVARKHADQGNLNALDNDPVPFVIQYSGGSAAPQVFNWHAGAPTRLDVDNSKATGQG